MRLLKNNFLSVAASAAGVSVLVQALAFLRQVLVAACFGVGRDYDSYVMVYSIATIVVFTFGGIFDSIAVPHLVRARENDGDRAARALAMSIFRFSLCMGLGVSLIFIIAVFVLAPVVATGFSAPERAGLESLTWFFLPWTLICLPYYAAAAFHKMEWRFNRVFAAEITVVAVSIGFLLMWHNDVRMLPLAYAAGYLGGLVQLVAGTPLWRLFGDRADSLRAVMRNIGELFLANQTGGLTTVVDRHVQSFLAGGGVAAVNYSSQIVTSLSGLLSFREIYVVPLTKTADRTERLERLISGLVLLAIPASGLIVAFAPDLVSVLLQRGRFDAAATELTAQTLRIAAFTLVTSAMTTPLFRMFQICDRINYTHITYVATACALAIFGYLFVVELGWGVRGVALMQLASAIVSLIVIVYLVAQCGIALRWSLIVTHMALAGVISIVAYAAAVTATLHTSNVWGRLIVGGSIYCVVVLSGYFLARGQLRGIVFGFARTET